MINRYRLSGQSLYLVEQPGQGDAGLFSYHVVGTGKCVFNVNLYYPGPML